MCATSEARRAPSQGHIRIPGEPRAGFEDNQGNHEQLISLLRFRRRNGVATWTHNHVLLAQLLSNEVGINHITSEDLETEKSHFDVYLQSPRFPDSVASVLNRYTRDKSYVMKSLDHDRLLIKLTLFNKIMIASDRFCLENDKDWQCMIANRWASMGTALEFYQIALGCPSFTQQEPDPTITNAISYIFDKEDTCMTSYLKDIQDRSVYTALLRYVSFIKDSQGNLAV